MQVCLELLAWTGIRYAVLQLDKAGWLVTLHADFCVFVGINASLCLSFTGSAGTSWTEGNKMSTQPLRALFFGDAFVLSRSESAELHRLPFKTLLPPF